MLPSVTAIVDIDTCISRRHRCVFDGEVKQYLSPSPQLGQVVYHFAIATRNKDFRSRQRLHPVALQQFSGDRGDKKNLDVWKFQINHDNSVARAAENAAIFVGHVSVT
jgi:hypothetical protein